MPFPASTPRIRRRETATRAVPPDRAKARRGRIRIPERALLGAAMTGALMIAERWLNRMQKRRDALPPAGG